MNAQAGRSIGGADEWTALDLGREGRICIEASAGTGKTWTIAALYLRLVLERGLRPRQIVVTTFTEAAATELRERLRAALLLAEREASSPSNATAGPGSYEAWLSSRWQRGGQRHADLDTLRLALAQLDIAPIGTLHGLCRRILADHPFASASEFVLPELVAGEAVLEEVVNDLWRIVRQGDENSPSVKSLIASGAFDNVDELRRAVKLLLAPGVAVTTPPPVRIAGARDWSRRLRTIAETPKLIAANAEARALREGWVGLAEWLADDAREIPHALAGGLKLAAKDTCFLKDGRASAEVGAARAFILQTVLPVLESARLAALAALADVARTRMRETLARRNQMRFDDLLLRVKEAMDGEAAVGAYRLADALHAAWPVALIDEFQDTDALQFGILDAIYRAQDASPRGLLVMIGDPKQAIYRFRGGDIDAYRAAVARADQHLTLRVNRRSSRNLVAALNEFYTVGGARMSAFADRTAIEYVAVEASDRCDAQPYTIGDEIVRKPLVVRYHDDGSTTVGPRRAAALTQCANQIVRMLQTGEHRIGKRAVSPADIAVLLPTSKAIAELRDLLRARGVACATSDQTSVFRTDIARELQIVLFAVANAGDLGALRAAAATRLWGASFVDLQRYGDDPALWQPIASRFHAWQGIWNERGVMAVIEQLLDHMAARYIATPAGARAITDLRHLGELLQTEGDALAGREELLSWLTRRRRDEGDDSSVAADAAQLRIESDADRVRIMTLHLSKGLEFPIVFLPLMWDHTQHPMQNRSKLFVVHADGGRQVGVAEADRTEERRDLQDERFRVLYVALTRAIHACHVFLPPPDKRKKDIERSALDEIVARMAPELMEPGESHLSSALSSATPHISWTDDWLPDTTERYRPPGKGAAPLRTARALPNLSARVLEAKHSFTTLSQFASTGPESDSAAADEIDVERPNDLDSDVADPTVSVPAIMHPELARLAAVRGADFGNAIHAIFERRDIGVPLSAQRGLVARCLDEARVRRRDVDPETLVSATSECLSRALSAPLGLAHAPRLRLDDVAARDQRAEMEFHFAIDRVAMRRLREACARHGEPELVPRSQAVLSGLMTGKIDLVFAHAGRFHVLDYKGNWLGGQVRDYSGAALVNAMDASHYRFQALLYSIAVDRYLRQRIGRGYDRQSCLGECIYLFVRAAGIVQDAGIWRHRFDDALLAAVDDVLAGGETGAEAA